MSDQVETDKAEMDKAECTPKSLSFFNSGIRTGEDFANGMSALMSDLASGRITPQVGNAICNAGGKLLKIVDMQYRYGTKSGESGKTLQLASGKVEG